MNKALFLDRDGVINRDDGYTHLWSENIIIDGVIEVIKRFKAQGFMVFIVTNQSGISRGYYSDKSFKLFMKNLVEFLHSKGATIDDYFYCRCGPSGKPCPKRKPNPGMFYLAEEKYKIDLPNSFMIGDNISDMIAADRALIKNKILFNVDSKPSHPSFAEVDFTFTHDLSKIRVSQNHD